MMTAFCIFVLSVFTYLGFYYSFLMDSKSIKTVKGTLLTILTMALFILLLIYKENLYIIPKSIMAVSLLCWGLYHDIRKTTDKRKLAFSLLALLGISLISFAVL